MGFKIVLVLFIVSVFYDCSAVRPYQEFSPASGNFKPRFKRCAIGPCHHLYRPFYYPIPVRTTTTTTTEEPRKEYGKESRLFDNSIKKKYFVSQENRLSWYDARDACRKRGMILTSPTTSLEKIELEHYLRDLSILPKDQYSGYWIGSHRISETEPFIWESNNEEIRPFGWLPGEPNGNDGENCMEFKVETIQSGWNNYYCSALRGYICESLPTTLESDKNVIEYSKESVHEEVAKESVNDNNGSNQSDSVDEEVQISTEEYRDYSAEAERRYQDILRRYRFYSRKSYDSEEDDVSSSSATPSRSDTSTITNPDSDRVTEAATDPSSAHSSERDREDVTVTQSSEIVGEDTTVTTVTHSSERVGEDTTVTTVTHSSERVSEDTTVTPSAQNSESPVTMQLYRHRSMPLIYQDYYPESDW